MSTVIDWNDIFGGARSCTGTMPGHYEPATDSTPATVYLPTRGYADFQVLLYERRVPFVSFSNTRAEAHVRFEHFQVAAKKRGVSVKTLSDNIVSNPDSADCRPIGRFIRCITCGTRCEHVPVVFFDHPDGEFTDQRAFSDARYMGAPYDENDITTPPLIVKPLRAKLEWWIVSAPIFGAGSFLRLLAGSEREAIEQGLAIYGHGVMLHAEKIAGT